MYHFKAVNVSIERCKNLLLSQRFKRNQHVIAFIMSSDLRNLLLKLVRYYKISEKCLAIISHHISLHIKSLIKSQASKM